MGAEWVRSGCGVGAEWVRSGCACSLALRTRLDFDFFTFRP